MVISQPQVTGFGFACNRIFVMSKKEYKRLAAALTLPEQEAARKRREEKAAREPRPKPRLYGRLPHGANFNVTWNADAGKWSGTLTVPQGGIYNGSVTEGEDSAVFALLMKLDRAYRKLPVEEGAPPETPTA